ncbi:uncharacterized protein ACA1_295510 [Acanthamoeba castellanii str. Neff]|uniref:Uncharacterized protein n=1 Tax=Acanthamoeba castellanii (strain ATCC 30010 / Neff) TaxID=1257118 RepID=L8HJS8_ACACF|nr:uncharacterized protein ACA1_295510 [Acanthamoeba castellanii str. Neff]ELR25465.1 hypothetical protein ACA1_295510 [Acanthamoeba castellanii str. Neff]
MRRSLRVLRKHSEALSRRRKNRASAASSQATHGHLEINQLKQHMNTNGGDDDVDIEETDEEEPPEALDMLEKQEAAPATKGLNRGQKRRADEMREADEELEWDLEMLRRRDGVGDHQDLEAEAKAPEETQENQQQQVVVRLPAGCALTVSPQAEEVDDEAEEEENEAEVNQVGQQPPAPPAPSARSEEGRKRRKLKQKKKRTRHYKIIVPESDATTRQMLEAEIERPVLEGEDKRARITRSVPAETVCETYLWYDQRDTPRLGLLRNRLTAEMLQTLLDTATDWMTTEEPTVYQARNTPRHKERNGHRTKAAHCGTWRKSSTELHIMPDTNTAGAQAFIKQNAELFKRVNDELRKYWPRVMEMYAAICPTRPDGSPVLPNTDFHEFVLNWDIECNFHTDKSDAGWGFCVVIPFGEFTGGELIFPGLGQSAHLIAGDIMVFPLPCSSTAMEKSRLILGAACCAAEA